MPEQLTLSGVQLIDHAQFNNFYVGDNEACVAVLKTLHDEPQYVYLWGEQGSGRSHLLQACCQTLQQCQGSAFYLPLAEFKTAPTSILDNIEQLDLVCIDDIDHIAGFADWEEALFDFFNQSRAAGQALVISGTCPPRQLPIRLADLLSRLTSGLIFQVHVLNDTQKVAALQMRAHNRGFELPEAVAQYILHHCSRNTSDLFAVLDTLDQASLSAGRRLTIPFVKTVLGI